MLHSSWDAFESRLRVFSSSILEQDVILKIDLLFPLGLTKDTTPAGIPGCEFFSESQMRKELLSQNLEQDMEKSWLDEKIHSHGSRLSIFAKTFYNGCAAIRSRATETESPDVLYSPDVYSTGDICFFWK